MQDSAVAFEASRGWEAAVAGRLGRLLSLSGQKGCGHQDYFQGVTNMYTTGTSQEKQDSTVTYLVFRDCWGWGRSLEPRRPGDRLI